MYSDLLDLNSLLPLPLSRPHSTALYPWGWWTLTPSEPCCACFQSARPFRHKQTAWRTFKGEFRCGQQAVTGRLPQARCRLSVGHRDWMSNVGSHGNCKSSRGTNSGFWPARVGKEHAWAKWLEPGAASEGEPFGALLLKGGGTMVF